MLREHIKTINGTRKALRIYRYTATPEDEASQKFAEACKEAEDSLRNVLIIARTWLREDVSDEEIFLSEEEELPVK